MKIECFERYTTEDLILDKDFIELVRNPDKKQELDDLIESFPKKRFEINLAIEIVDGLQVKKFHQSTDRKNALWNNIVTKQKRHIRFDYLKYAAAVLLLIGVGSIFYFVNFDSTTTELADNSFLDNSLTVNENDITLVLSDGKTYPIQSDKSTIKYSADGSQISVNETDEVVQDVVHDRYNKMIVPFGKQSMVVLSDGTKVWLNSGSTLIFPPAFNGKSREVQLIGEAFFDVTHNKEMPFFVKTAAFEMKVYGTKFDVQSYKQDNASSVILVEGLVSMRSKDTEKEVFLAPRQRATMVDGSTNIQIDNIDNVEEYTSWTEGYLSFSDKDLEHILKQVSRYYNIDIDVTSTNDIEKIYGKLELKDDPEQVLDGISFLSKTKYRKVGNKYEFYQ